MDDARIGAACRAVRIRKRLTQADLASSASVRPVEISRLEAGALKGLSVATLRSVAGALGMWFDLVPRWRGVDLGQMLNGAHAALQGDVLARFERLESWVAEPEVSFSIFGERGAIDILAWHEPSNTLLIVELKTLLVDPAELVRKMDQRTRLAPRIARERGWALRTVARWVILTDTRTNRRHVAAHRAVLAPLTGADGRHIRAWLRRPVGRSQHCRSGRTQGLSSPDACGPAERGPPDTRGASETWASGVRGVDRTARIWTILRPAVA